MKRLSLLFCSVAAIGLAQSPTVSTCIADEQFITQPKNRTNATFHARASKLNGSAPNNSPSETPLSVVDQGTDWVEQAARDLDVAEQSQSGILWVKRDRKGTSQTTVVAQPSAEPSRMSPTPGGTSDDNSLPSSSQLAKRSTTSDRPTLGGHRPHVQHRVAASPSSVTIDSSTNHSETTPRSEVPAQAAGYRTPSAESTNDAENSVSMTNKMKLASAVSKRILGPQDTAARHEVSPLQTTLGWNAVGAQLKGHLEQCTELTRRGVFASAREEALTALLQLTRHLDQLTNRFVSEPSLQAAQTAVREAECFTDTISAVDIDVLRQITNSHITPILKDAEVQSASPLTLSQYYYKYAESKLVEASQGHPWYSEILYGLGRAYQAEAELAQGNEKQLLFSKALVYYQSAVTILPKNALASNQLGYVLLQLDRAAEAQQALIASVNIQPDAPALQNLAEASRRLGDKQLEDWALRTLSSRNQMAGPIVQVPTIEMVDNRTFMAISPMTIGPKSAPRTADVNTGQTLIR